MTDCGSEPLAAATHEFGDDGAASADGIIVGTYIHGCFDDDAFRAGALAAARAAVGLAPRSTRTRWQAERELRLADWSAHVRTHLDLELIAQLIAR